MSFPKYPEYKNSGIEWLGEVPAHWEVRKIAHGFSRIGSGTTPPSNEPKWYDGGSIPWVTTSELRENLILETKKSISDEALSEFTSLQVHPPGSLAVAMYGATIGRLGVFGVSATTNQACCVLSGSKSISSKFAFYWLLAFKDVIVSLYATGGGQPNINQETIASLRLPAPSLADQAKVFTFLDHETARIDALVEEQQRLIELLKEKRQAVISHAVTKGLYPDVPMKDSGVEWLGEVPEHWELKRLGDIVEFSQGKAHEPFIDSDGEYICVNSRFVSTSGQSVKRCSENFTPAKEGDVLIVMSDLPNGRALARAFLVEQPNLYAVNQRVCRIRPLADFSLFLFYLLDRHPALLLKDDGFNQTHLSGSDFTHLRLYLPPEEEQFEIVKYLRAHTYKSDELLTESNSNIALLKERRSALVSAAVTGKIDVRGWQPPADQYPVGGALSCTESEVV